MNKRFFQFTSIALLFASVGAAYAVPVPVTSNGECTSQLDSVQISKIEPMLPTGTGFSPSGTSIGGMSYPIHSTNCLGFVITPDNDWGNSPNPNQGKLGDGLLNEQPSKPKGKKDPTQYVVEGDYFLTHANDSMVDLDGDGNKTDPGWIRLGGSDTGAGTGAWAFNYDFINGYDLDAVLDITFGINNNAFGGGYWSIKVDPAAIPFATMVLGRPSLFDHLAFVMKGSNNQEASWAIFDFNFYDLIDDGLDISLGDTAYYFEGYWDAGVINGQNLSHVSIWAHDPPTSGQDVPAPLPILLIGTGLLLLCQTRGKRRA